MSWSENMLRNEGMTNQWFSLRDLCLPVDCCLPWCEWIVYNSNKFKNKNYIYFSFQEEAENRETLAKELNLKNWSNEGQGQGPLLLEVLKAARANSQQGPATSPKTTVAYVSRLC